VGAEDEAEGDEGPGTRKEEEGVTDTTDTTDTQPVDEEEEEEVLETPS
jgi:hypothetical protein